jgi:hypothetical protein
VSPKKGRPGSQSRDPGSARRRRTINTATEKGTAMAVTHKFQYTCPVCDGRDKLTVERKRDGRGWWVNCWSCPGGGDYLRALAAAVDAPSGELLEDPLRWLVDLAVGESRVSREPAPLPFPAELAGWYSDLLGSPGPLAYLLNERGLSREVIERYQIGWDGEAFTLPVWDVRTGKLINLRRRRWPRPWPDGSRYRGLRGRPGRVLYPNVPPDGPLVLCAGEFDALVCRRHGLSTTITVCSGSGTDWSGDWNDLVAGRKVAVVFDADPREEAQAESRAAQLREAGADSWVVRLSSEGLKPKEDLTDWFVTHGRTGARLRRAMNEARRRRKGGRT